MITSNKWVVQLVVDQCVEHGVTHWVFSPGSRNAPLAISADHHPKIETIVIHDERSAAFFALGLAEKLGRPVAICCTSGSAPTNYLPAVTEAFYRSIPLLVISADRPEAWTDQGDGQTIRQRNLFRDFTHRSLHLEDQKEDKTTLWQYQRQTALLFNKLHLGPAHINVGLAEPLYKTEDKKRFFHRTISVVENFTVDPSVLNNLSRLMLQKKIMVLCGQLPASQGLQDALEKFAHHDHVVVLTENTSNLSSSRFIPCIDRSLNCIDDAVASEFLPDVLISIGGAIVSKRIKSFLRKAPLTAHIRVGIDFREMDTYQQLTHSIIAQPTDFFTGLSGMTIGLEVPNYFNVWKKLDLEANRKMTAFQAPKDVLVDFNVYKSFLNRVPEHSVIHLGNSSVIRYMQLFDPAKACIHLSNRGTSGIDGCLSTAMGYASKDDRLNVLIIGDVSFLYDVSALQLQDLSPNLKILIVNNQGGGIFNIIDGAKDSPQCEKYFEAKHSRNGAVSASYGWKYACIEEVELLDEAMNKLLLTTDINCLEIRTNKHQSPQVLNSFFNFIK
ncbi:MAG: 2-succinyl-5-enolpyruvyl-6-hydroxy-3-cyclohexene-1-carboxylic-acid synthase [Bacteroidetes bacterium]|nr:2-succinyl-5-enolpyruvyl-6-hydroxy-3-cyclohexene-1-carboxylic-acid synthase [Bacteroidota bacterium]MBM3423933.1 2-succinyl-5-enolpyruvyl-6-hydroxy-3-cyclohexene-1-carboxylic-acid synthase [Bacteroidota bacterium]